MSERYPTIDPPPLPWMRAEYKVELGMGIHRTDEAAEVLAYTGCRRVRITLYPHDPPEKLDALRQLYLEGYDLLVVVHDSTPRPMEEAERQESREIVLQTAVQAAAALPGCAIQLWNEPDYPVFTDVFGAFSGWPMRERGEAYGAWLTAARSILGHSGCTIVTAGLATVDRDLEQFLEGMRGAPFDVLALHCYGLPVSIAVRQKPSAARALFPDKRIWITETGLEEAVIPKEWGLSPAGIDLVHEIAFSDAIVQAEQDRLVERVYWHVWRQGGDLSYDMVREDGSFRPAALRFRKLIGESR